MEVLSELLLIFLRVETLKKEIDRVKPVSLKTNVMKYSFENPRPRPFDYFSSDGNASFDPEPEFCTCEWCGKTVRKDDTDVMEDSAMRVCVKCQPDYLNYNHP